MSNHPAAERVLEGAAFVVLLPITVPIWVGMTAATLIGAPAALAFHAQLAAVEAAGIPTPRTRDADQRAREAAAA